MYCFNSRCPKPQNPEKSRFCQTCGARLLLGDRYRGFSRLGEGQSSRTVLGLDTHQLFDPRCVIKGFVQAAEESDARVEAFRQEVARLAVISQHPQMPDLLAYFERDRQQFLVQEFVDGRNLLHQLSEEGSFDESQILQVLREVLPVLQFLHDRQIIHRDVKPANLVRRHSDQKLILVDYGAAKIVNPSTVGKTGTVMGSAEYAAPEQLMGKAVFASDLYGLGVTCIHLLAGLRPFELFNTATGTWLWRSAAGRVSDRLVRIIDKLLQGTVNQRYASAASVLQSLDMGSALLTLPTSGTQTIAPPLLTPQRWNEVCTLTTSTEINTLALDSANNTLISGGNDGTVSLWQIDENLSQDLRKNFDLAPPPPKIGGNWIGSPPESGDLGGKCVSPISISLLKPLIETQGAIAALALSFDGTAIATAHRDNTLKLWDRHTGQLLHTLSGHRSNIICIAMHPKQSQVISGSRDKTLQFWDLKMGESLLCFTGHTAAVEAIAISANGQLLASGDAQGAIKIWHLGTQELLRTLPKHAEAIGAIALSPDGQTVISSGWDMAVQVRDLHTGGVRHTFKGHLLPVTSVAVSPDGTTLATGSHDTTIKLWELAQGKLLSTLTGHTAAVEAIAFTSNGAIVSGSKDGTIRVWKQEVKSEE